MTLLTLTLVCLLFPNVAIADEVSTAPHMTLSAYAAHTAEANDVSVASLADDARAPLVADAQPTNADRAPRKRATLSGAIPPGIVQLATTMVTLPMGAERIMEIDGKTYAFVLEPHYHAPGSTTTAPTGWHKGVTVYSVD
jgi:hypothetical protein